MGSHLPCGLVVVSLQLLAELLPYLLDCKFVVGVNKAIQADYVKLILVRFRHIVQDRFHELAYLSLA